MRWILQTRPDLSATIARIALGLFILPHGAQKALGWFGGHGIEGTVGFMQSQLGIPPLFAYLAIAAEFLGGIGLLLGLFSRVASFGVVVTMVVAALTVHLSTGFFSGPAGAGWELHYLAVALGAIVLIRGGGAASLDLAISKPAPQDLAGNSMATPKKQSLYT